jgi:hypothetical protein
MNIKYPIKFDGQTRKESRLQLYFAQQGVAAQSIEAEGLRDVTSLTSNN